MVNLESDRWGAFRSYYFDKHREFLSNVWYDYQKYTPRNIRERVDMLKKEDYAQIEGELKLVDIEEKTREIIQHCKDLLHDPDSCHIYLFIGFFSPDGFVMRYRGNYVVCIGLERFRHFKNFDILLSHEYCHYILNKQGGNGGDSLARKLIREGIAVYFSRTAYPGRDEESYFFLKRERLQYLKENFKPIVEKIREGKLEGEDLFGPRSKTLPPRTGYFVGARLVEDFIKKTGITDINFLLRDENQIFMDF